MRDATRQHEVLLLPGLGDSGPAHWQSLWEARDPGIRRLRQREWDAPVRDDWVRTLEDALAARSEPVVLAGHSTGAILVAHWLRDAAPAQIARVAGALIVAPSDPQGPNYPAGPTGFDPVPTAAMPFRAIVVASDRDPYAALDWSRRHAQAWGADCVVLHDAGHINTDSGHGAWPEGYALLERLRARD